ncbi:MmcB family DNA repair protein [Lichenicoccus sp.]|uniref:MmcB family DNA repair protein n=1 Tax=Lichenicoccus sp. TaxID=2781899 RepID=UPI003D115497
MQISDERRSALAAHSLAIRRAAARLCGQLGWAPLHEVPLPNGRRADILALRPDGGFACIEVKSGPRDFLTDTKWQDYRAYSDALYFAVDEQFPRALLPPDTGLVVACVGPHCAPGSLIAPDAEILREAPAHALAPARRRALLQRFATVAAQRLAMLEDPAVTASLRAALKVE